MKIVHYRHRGLHHKRYNDSGRSGERERAFVKHWFKQNQDGTFRQHFGSSTIEALCRVTCEMTDKGAQRDKAMSDGWYRWAIYPWNREVETMVATVIQWLGSNIGFEFLKDVLRECGYEVVDVRERRRA